MVKGIKRVMKHLRTACHENRRHRRLSDHRAVALGVHYVLTGLFKPSRLTGTHGTAPGTGSAGACPPDAQGENRAPATCASSIDQDLHRIDQAGSQGYRAVVLPTGHIADFTRNWANA